MDHLVKPIAYCILALHWFNPLVWIAFVLFCKDIEYACDEKVLKNAAADIRKEYATALLECASKRSFLAACPIAFGEVSVKERVKKTMNYKRPLLWVIIVSVLLCALVAVLFFTAPMDEESAPNTPSEEQTSSEASTELSIEESTESSIEESSVTEPSEPEESQPEESQPDESEPEVSEPEVSEPEVSEPEVSEPEVSDPPEEPVIPPTLELPPETETKLEKEFRFEIGVDHPWAYTATYHDFGDYADPEFPISFYVDQKGNYYGVSYSLGWWNQLVCLNTGETLPYEFNKTVSNAIFDEELVYVTTEDGYVRVFDISEGMENGVLTDEWNPWDRFGHDGVLRLYNGEVLFFSKATTGPVCTLDGEPIERKDAYQYVTRADQVVTKLEDGTFAVFRDKGVCSHYATCNSSEWLGLEHQVHRTYTDQYSTRETVYTCHGANGEVVSRVLISEDRSYWYEPCNIGIYACIIRHYKPRTVSVNGTVFENVVGYKAFWGPEGKLCVIILYPDHGEFYTVTGITHEEMTPVTEENAEKPEMPTIITIHSLEREDLVEFLEDPAGYAWDKGWIGNIPADGVPGHVTQAYDRIYFRPDFLELYNDHAVMERYLLSRGVSCTVTKVAFFESLIAPFTLYVETADGTLYFIGVEDHTDSYTYTLYTEKEYVGSFLEKPIKIVINGKELQSEFTFCRYGEYAEIPFIATMDALGADLYWRREGYAEITMGANTCYVDTRDSSLQYGGVYPTASLPFSPKYGDEIILRTDTLQEFFKAFCHGVTVRVDAEESVVYIDNQYADTIECYFSPDGKSVLYAVWNEDEAYDWYRIVGDGEPEALPIDIQPYRDSMKRWANDFSVVYFTNINQSTFLSCLYKWDENGEVSLLSETCYADALSVLYEDGSFYFQERTTVSYDTFIENDLGEAGEEPMAWVSRMRARLATVYYYDGNEKKLAAENVWCDATSWDPYAAEASGGAYLTLDPGEKVKLSTILEIVGENRNVGWLDKAMRAFAKCIYTVKDQYYTVDLDRASVAIIAKDAKHLAVLSDWDPHTEFGTLYLVKIGEQGVEEVTLISEKISSKEPMRMNAYFSGSNYLVYRADGAERDTYVQIGDQS